MENEISPAIWLDVHDLRIPLEEAQETLRAIRQGEVDALVIRPDEDARVLTLAGADQIYRALLETLNEGALTLGSDARILSANSRFAAMVGLAPAQVTGMPLPGFVAHEYQTKFLSLLEAGLQGESKGEVSLLRADGARVRALLSLRAVPIPGAGHFVTAVVTDVTELREAQEALEQVNAELEARVAERTAALTAADRRKDEFLAMLGHELRNPLSVLSNALYLLRQHSTEPAAVRPRELMERQVQRLVRLAGDLTDLSRIRQGKVTMAPLRLDLAQLVRDAGEESRSAIENAGLTLALELPPEPVWVEGDPDRLVQVIANLLHNAAKFTDPGGQVTVGCRVKGEGRRVPASGPTPNTLHPTPCAIVTVRDTGIGIEPEMLAEIFETFRQVEESPEAPRARGQGGLGLGLALVKGLIEMHGGTISAHSDGLGHGAEFTLFLPLAEPRETHSEPE